MKSDTKFRKSISLLVFSLVLSYSMAQETKEYTVNVNGTTVMNYITAPYNSCWDEFTIVASNGVNWLRVIESRLINPVWEQSTNIIYDGVPIVGQTTKTVKRPPPCEGCGWECTGNLALVATGQGRLIIRAKAFNGLPPFAIEGEYLDKYDGTYESMYGSITANPSGVQPGNTTNIEVRLPEKMRRVVSGIRLYLPDARREKPTMVILPFDIDGVYNFNFTIPNDGSFERLNVPFPFEVKFEALSINPGSDGQPYVVTAGVTLITIASTLTLEINVQGTIVQNGGNVTWNNSRERVVGLRILNGKEPFKTRWIVNGQEVPLPPDPDQNNTQKFLRNQNVLTNAATITAEVTDANGNTASTTINVNIRTDLSFQFNVQGVKTENGATVNWREGSAMLVTANPVFGGRDPIKSRWLINNEEVLSHNLINKFDQFTDQEILGRAQSITLELTDANGIKSSGTIFIGNPANAQTPAVPTGPVGPAPTPPPLTGNPNIQPNPDVSWNNRPWLNEKVQQCTREYLQRIVLYMENEIRKWENTGRAESEQMALFTSIDDWGRLLNQYITASGRVDGNWDNPTHYVWSAFNQPSASTRYGRTVEYYVKYECNILQYDPDDIDSAIADVANANENNKWDPQKVKSALLSLNDMLELARSLYSKFNLNYLKFVNEINDQNSNPLENQIIALCIASAHGQFNDHSVNKDSIDASGGSLITQAASNKDINIFNIINILSEVQTQADDMTRKLGEMKNLLTVRGGDVDEIITSGQNLIAQGNINPEFAQDGGVNVEFAGDGLDNIGDGLQDFLQGNIRRGNVLIIIWDSGNYMDDVFELIISGIGSMGTTPPGARRNFDLTLGKGTYTLTIRAIYTDPNITPCTFGIQVYDQDIPLISPEEGLGNLDVGQERSYVITIR